MDEYFGLDGTLVCYTYNCEMDSSYDYDYDWLSDGSDKREETE